jgi:hypothetical protein
MIAFTEDLPNKTGTRRFTAREDGKVIAAGGLTLTGTAVKVKIEHSRDGEALDFMFRSLLNVCAGFNGLTVAAPEDLDEGYLIGFGFKNRSVAAEDIRFACNCRKAKGENL